MRFTLNKNNKEDKIICATCKKKHIGQTSLNLKSRIYEQKSGYNIRLNACASLIHVYNTKYDIENKNVKILHVENNYYKRTFLEMVHIPLYFASISAIIFILKKGTTNLILLI